jgi:hypothetical protein
MPQSAGQLVLAIWLAEQLDAVVQPAVTLDQTLRITGGEQHLRIRLQDAHAVGELEAGDRPGMTTSVRTSATGYFARMRNAGSAPFASITV